MALSGAFILASCQEEDSGKQAQTDENDSANSGGTNADDEEVEEPEAPTNPHGLAEEDLKKTRVRYSFGGTQSLCGPNNVLTVFEDGRVYCHGNEYVEHPKDCLPTWKGIGNLDADKAAKWIEEVRAGISDKVLGIDGCDGAWSYFRLFSNGEMEARTKNLSCSEDGSPEESLSEAAFKIWDEVCVPLRPGSV